MLSTTNPFGPIDLVTKAEALWRRQPAQMDAAFRCPLLRGATASKDATFRVRERRITASIAQQNCSRQERILSSKCTTPRAARKSRIGRESDLLLQKSHRNDFTSLWECPRQATPRVLPSRRMTEIGKVLRLKRHSFKTPNSCGCFRTCTFGEKK